MFEASQVRQRLVLAFIASAALACAGSDPTGTRGSVLDGLARGVTNDTGSTTPPPPNPTPGAFRGYVIGRGTGTDTIATAPRIAGVTVTVYPHVGNDGTEPRLGAAVASFATDVNGLFQSPTLAGGDYVVTFVPPADSPYRGVYVTTTIHSGSGSGTWWIVLATK